MGCFLAVMFRRVVSKVALRLRGGKEVGGKREKSRDAKDEFGGLVWVVKAAAGLPHSKGFVGQDGLVGWFWL